MMQQEATEPEGMKRQQKEKSKVQIGGGIKRQQEATRGREGGGDKEEEKEKANLIYPLTIAGAKLQNRH